MSFTPTTNYALQKPAVGTELDAWGDDLNTNLDLIDGLLKANADAIAAASAAAANSVDNTKLANMSSNTIKGCLTAGDPVDLTGAQATTIISEFSSTLKGLVPASGGVATNFLCANGTWVAPAAGSSVVADDSITNAKLANMAASTVKGSLGGGDPADLSGTQVTTLLDAFTTSLKGVVPASGGGTTNFMRADGTWAAPPAAGAVAWGTITGTLSSQTDLNTALVTETPNAQTGTSYTLVAADAGKMVTCNNGGATFTLTVNSSVFAANSRVDIIQLGAAQVTFAGSATRRANPSGANKLTGQYSGATLWFISASEYVLFGDITT